MFITPLLAAMACVLVKRRVASAPATPRCDGCTTPLAGDYGITRCCDHKLCGTCSVLYTAKSRSRCCLCHAPR